MYMAELVCGNRNLNRGRLSWGRYVPMKIDKVCNVFVYKIRNHNSGCLSWWWKTFLFLNWTFSLEHVKKMKLLQSFIIWNVHRTYIVTNSFEETLERWLSSEYEMYGITKTWLHNNFSPIFQRLSQESRFKSNCLQEVMVTSLGAIVQS